MIELRLGWAMGVVAVPMALLESTVRSHNIGAGKDWNMPFGRRSEMATEDLWELVSDFASIGIERDDATMKGAARRANHEAKRLPETFNEIKDFGVAGREALLSLVENDNLLVAKMAAVYSIRYKPDRCLVVLTSIAREPGLLGFGAEQALRNWTLGNWHIDEDGTDVGGNILKMFAPQQNDLFHSNIQPEFASPQAVLESMANGDDKVSSLAKDTIRRNQEMDSRIKDVLGRE